jgi:threonine/homoserine/homoserine lactone efflux protein
LIHVKWLERNAWAKGGELDKPYAQLPEPEKQKDREALYQAIHKGLALKILNPQQVSAPVSAAIAQMLAKIKN